MKFVCDRQKLASTLSMINNVIPARSLRTVLQNVCIKGNDNNIINLLGTDLEIGVGMTVETEELSDPQTILVNSAKLTAILNEDKSEKITFETEADSVNIITQRGNFKFVTSTEEFPELKEIDDDEFISINGEDLQEAIEKTRFAVSHSDGIYAFNGICICYNGNNEADFVASDGNRLSLITKKIENPKSLSNICVVLSKGFTELARFADKKNSVDIKITKNEMIARTGNIRLVSRLLEGKFPKYLAVIPTDTPLSMKINKQEFLNGLRLVNKMCSEDVRNVNLDGYNNKLVLSISNGAVGSVRYEIDAEIIGGDIDTAFNCANLIEGISSIKSEEIIMKFVKNGKPVLLEEQDYQHMLTPVNKG